MRVARHYVIGGRVQGVGFRYFTADVAARENISGWVRNLANGRVEIEAEGDADALRRFDSQVRQGPRGARVEDVMVDDRQPGSAAQGFQTR